MNESLWTCEFLFSILCSEWIGRASDFFDHTQLNFDHKRNCGYELCVCMFHAMFYQFTFEHVISFIVHFWNGFVLHFIIYIVVCTPFTAPPKTIPIPHSLVTQYASQTNNWKTSSPIHFKLIPKVNTEPSAASSHYVLIRPSSSLSLWHKVGAADTIASPPVIPSTVVRWLMRIPNNPPSRPFIFPFLQVFSLSSHPPLFITVEWVTLTMLMGGKDIHALGVSLLLQ